MTLKVALSGPKPTTQRLQNSFIKEYTLNYTRVQYPPIKEYTLNHIRVPIIV